MLDNGELERLSPKLPKLDRFDIIRFPGDTEPLFPIMLRPKTRELVFMPERATVEIPKTNSKTGFGGTFNFFLLS
jgi:hypothetical protein